MGKSESMRSFLSHSRPIRFFGVESSARRVLLLSCSLPIRDFGVGSLEPFLFYFEMDDTHIYNRLNYIRIRGTRENTRIRRYSRFRVGK